MWLTWFDHLQFVNTQFQLYCSDLRPETLLFGYQVVAYYNVVTYKSWSRYGGSTVLT